MADIENEVLDPASPGEAPADAVSNVEPSRRASVRDTIAAIDAELARHAPSAPAVSLSDAEV